MIFSIQRYLEDFFERRGLRDVDQYAISYANVYDRTRPGQAQERLKAIRRIRTAFYKNNNQLDRENFEGLLLSTLDKRFKKKLENHDRFPGGTNKERRQILEGPRLTISSILQGFKNATEARAVDAFWKSRKNGIMHSSPETVGQSLLAVFAKGVLSGRSGLVLREVLSGIGFVDLMIILSQVPHLVEMKIVRRTLDAVAQIESYMTKEGRSVGWLLLIDARPHPRSESIPGIFRLRNGIVRTVVVEINPIPPSRIRLTSN